MSKSILLSALVVFSLCFSTCHGWNNGVGRTPPMGFNTWNHFACGINETLIVNTAQAMIDKGLRDVGYDYVNLDDCWQASRDSQGVIVEDKATFPSGIPDLVRKINAKKMKLGLYTCAGTKTCQGRPGSYGHYDIDAQTYAKWGVDYIKVDWCFTDGLDPKTQYTQFRDALNKTSRPIFFSLCEWGVNDPASWGLATGNSWRTSGDISCSYSSMLKNLDAVVGKAKFAGPGGWNDPDMLEVGNGCLSNDEEIAHFSLWSLVGSPLLLGADIPNMPASSLAIVKNKEVIAVNQDLLGKAGDRISTSNNGTVEVWARPLVGGNYAVILFNRGNNDRVSVSVKWSDLGIKNFASARVRDLWKHKDLGIFRNSFSTKLNHHSVAMLKVSPIHFRA